MYLFLLGLHNLLRWVVVLGGVYAVATALRGLLTRAAWSDADRRAGLIFTSALNLQLVVGVVLYLVSPLVRSALGNMGAAMGNDQLRYFSVEHAAIMLLAVVAAQLGYSLARRATTDRARFSRATIGYGLAAALIAYGVPWGRSLIPWG